MEGEDDFASFDNDNSRFVEPSKFKKEQGRRIVSLLKAELEKRKSQAGYTPKTRLHDYQIEAVQATANLLQRKPSAMALIVAPPGSGKSGMIVLLPYVLQSQRVLILTPSTIISTQIATDFGHCYKKKATAKEKAEAKAESFFSKVGICQNTGALNSVLETVLLCNTQKRLNDLVDSLEDDAKVVIVNAQKFGGNARNSLSKKKDVTLTDNVIQKLKEFDTIIVDEAHRYPAETWENVVNCFEGKKIVFLTATPCQRNDKEKMLAVSKQRIELAYEIRNDQVEGKTIRIRKFVEKEATNASNPDAFIVEVKENLLALFKENKQREPRLENPQAIVVVKRDKKEVEKTAKAFGDDAIAIISNSEKNRNIKDFKEGKKKIAVVCDILKEGVDNPNVILVAIIYKCWSGIKFEQFIGRCTRIHRNLPTTLRGKQEDRSLAVVLTYRHFGLRKLWDAMKEPKWATTSPEGDSDSDEPEDGELDASDSMEFEGAVE